MWFRKGLRIHDNPALDYAAAKGSNHLYPVFVIDPHYMEPDPLAFSPGSRLAGLNRIRFLLDSLVDLDASLVKLGSRLLVLKGNPTHVLITCLKQWDIKRLCFEHDTEPYYQALDSEVKNYASLSGIEVFSPVSHTLFNPSDIIQKLAGQPSWASSPLPTRCNCLPPLGNVGNCEIFPGVPSLGELGYDDTPEDQCPLFKGGESEALRRMRESINNKEWVANFEKPKGDPSAFLKPATTVLSAYLKCIQDVLKSVKKHTSPPVSLLGQLLWRDFFYTVAFGTPNFDQMRGRFLRIQFMNISISDTRACDFKQIPWNDDDELLAAWRDGRTGFPWIDAIMVQYNRIYSPITFGKKYDPNGDYIRHFLPVLKDMPKEYIYEPWTAPLSIQTRANCIVGKDYPKPVVSHNYASNECRRKLAGSYELNKKLNGTVTDDDLQSLRRKLEEQSEEPKPKRLKQKMISLEQVSAHSDKRK
ncbi:hypothetical protein LguiB_008259 [Lonicera macranthoides]